MAQNKVQYQRGLSMREFFNGYGSPEQGEALVQPLAMARGLHLPALPGQLAQRVPAAGAAVLPVQPARVKVLVARFMRPAVV